MTVKIFERWNWELDHGEGPLPQEAPLPEAFAIAYYDDAGYLLRVFERIKISPFRHRRYCQLAGSVIKELSGSIPGQAGSGPEPAIRALAYDYSCGTDGRVLQKRLLNENGLVVLVFDYEYLVGKNEAIKTVWSPGASQRLAFSNIDMPISISCAEVAARTIRWGPGIASSVAMR